MIVRHITDWDDSYANGIHIAGGDRWPTIWAEDAAAFRAEIGTSIRATYDVRYGAGSREVLDYFAPAGEPRVLVVFIHGGYWMEGDKNYWSHLAAGATAQGCAVAMPSYPLCPDVTISEIGRSIAAAIEAAADAFASCPIVLAGHSAGGHLATRSVAEGTSLSPSTLARVRRVVSISGLHDLRPLLSTQMVETLRLSEDEARRESPALLRPAIETELVCWVGGAEREEFKRQSELLANIWTGLRSRTKLTVEPDRHHFDILDGMTDPNHSLVHILTCTGPEY